MMTKTKNMMNNGNLFFGVLGHHPLQCFAWNDSEIIQKIKYVILRLCRRISPLNQSDVSRCAVQTERFFAALRMTVGKCV